MSSLTERIAKLPPEKRDELLRRLAERSPRARSGGSGLPRVEPRPEERYEPFPLTDIQEVYWAGRSGYFDLSTPGANVYLEYEIAEGGEVALERFEQALHRMFDRHEILRLEMLPDGRQRCRRTLPPFRIERIDLRGRDPEEVERRFEEVRQAFRYHEGPVSTWPLFGFLGHLLEGGRVRLHAWIDCWLIDGLSRDNLVRDLLAVLADPEVELPELECTYRDYALVRRAIRDSEPYRRARAFWLERIPSLPPPPDLPLARELGPDVQSRYTTDFVTLLDPAAWADLKARAARLGLTPSVPLIAAFVEVMRTWSRNQRFTISLEGTYWPPVHPQLREIVGNFNTVYVLTVEPARGTFEERAVELQRQLTDLLEHREFSGFEVLREINRREGGSNRSLMPVVFNSLVEYEHPSYHGGRAPGTPGGPSGSGPAPSRLAIAELDIAGNPPQLLMTPAVLEGGDGSLVCKFQELAELFRPGVVRDTRAAYVELVQRLAEDEGAWSEPRLSLTPPGHLARRSRGGSKGRGDGEAVADRDPLEVVESRIAATPDRTALVTGAWATSCAELWARAVAGREPAVDHRTLAATVTGLGRLLGLGEEDRVLSLTPAASDAGLYEALAAAVAGATTRVAEGPAAEALPTKGDFSAWIGPPALIDRMLAHLPPGTRLPGLRSVCLARDRIPLRLPERLRAAAPKARIVSYAGCPEVPAYATGLDLGHPDGRRPGSVVAPLHPFEIEVVDDRLHPRPDWVVGTLRVAGPGLAPESCPEQLARHLPEGGIELVGTEAEHAASVGGRTIDLGRLEVALERHPGVRAAACRVRRGPEGRGRLEATVVAVPDREGLEAEELDSFLESRLPSHLRPRRIRVADGLELTADGSVDRSELPAAAGAETPAAPVPPRDALEDRLVRLWAEILEIDSVGVTDNFFRLGGDSFTATLLLTRLERDGDAGVDLSEFFLEPTIEHLAAVMRD